MLEAAVEAGRDRVGVLGVTVLTSTSSDNLRDAGFLEQYCVNLSSLVLKRAAMAQAAGCAGVVCSGHEAAMIKDELGPDFLAVTPGIRPLWDVPKGDDQKRIVTPAEAVQKGSDYLVIGRPIRDAQDPRSAAQRIAAEIETIIAA
jgi:orotidine-5'-phosphate decarboxylase